MSALMKAGGWLVGEGGGARSDGVRIPPAASPRAAPELGDGRLLVHLVARGKCASTGRATSAGQVATPERRTKPDGRHQFCFRPGFAMFFILTCTCLFLA